MTNSLINNVCLLLIEVAFYVSLALKKSLTSWVPGVARESPKKTKVFIYLLMKQEDICFLLLFKIRMVNHISFPFLRHLLSFYLN